jgi:hypothetical protein
MWELFWSVEESNKNLAKGACEVKMKYIGLYNAVLNPFFKHTENPYKVYYLPEYDEFKLWGTALNKEYGILTFKAEIFHQLFTKRTRKGATR